MKNTESVREIPVWDRFVRIFHWSLVLSVVLNYFVFEGGGIHKWLGYLASGLVLARLVWGFIGSQHARFADFFPTPRRLLVHFQQLAAGAVAHSDGHNPLGALMMLALMGLVLALGITGWLMGTEAYWGDEQMEDFHVVLAVSLMTLVGLHVLAALVMSRIERTNLVAAMFTGIKRRRR